MTALRRTWPCWLLLVVAGCGRGAADWQGQLRSPDPARRLEAVHALQVRAREPQTVVPALGEALLDPDTYVRRDAARALGAFGPAAREAVPRLRELLRDREPGVRKAAAQALTRIDPSARKTRTRH